jgi:hypothetical protein
MFNSSDRFLSPPQIARMLRTSPDKVLLAIREGRLKAINLSGKGSRPRWKVAPADLQRWLDSRANVKQAKAAVEKTGSRRAIPKPSKSYF